MTIHTSERLIGHVTDRTTGRGIEGLDVEVWGTNYPAAVLPVDVPLNQLTGLPRSVFERVTDALVGTATTDADGRFDVPAVTGTVFVRIYDDDWFLAGAERTVEDERPVAVEFSHREDDRAKIPVRALAVLFVLVAAAAAWWIFFGTESERSFRRGTRETLRRVGLDGSDLSAPALDRTVAETFADQVAFLYRGPDRVQRGVEAETLDPTRLAVLRGLVWTTDGEPLPGVDVSILAHPEFGTTRSRRTGQFDFVVNAGMVVVRFERDGYLPVQRTVRATRRAFMWLPDVTMLSEDVPAVTVRLGESESQIVPGNQITDEDGTRRPTLLVPPETAAMVSDGDAGVRATASFDLQQTEYTVGPRGLTAMPAELPPTSGYTYAVELGTGTDASSGAVTQRPFLGTVGGDSVRFDRPVVHYVENFLEFPVGSPVPVGYYDRGRGRWVPAENGRVVRLLRVEGGLAVLDVEGRRRAADAETLAALGITDEERRQLADLYEPDQSVWRVRLSHFTPVDYNWPVGPPPDATDPPAPPEEEKKEPDPCEETA